MNEIFDTSQMFDGHEWKTTNLNWLQIPIGKYDMPELQQQGVQFIDIASDGHYGIYGTGGTGKTTLLKTIVTSAALHYTPEDIVFYILDCGGWSLNSLKGFPHVGDVVLDVEEEKIDKLIEVVEDEFNKRRKLFLDNKVSSLKAYRDNIGKLPAFILVVDNILPVFDNLPKLEDLLIKISRDGATYGMYLIYSANTSAGIRFKILQNINGAIAFELTDKGDYSSIVGKMDGKFLPKNNGRAFYKCSSPTEFHVAWYVNGANEIERGDNLQKLANQMNKAWEGEVPIPIPVMPDVVTTDDIIGKYKVRNKLPLGIRYDNISLSQIDLSSKYGLIVTGSIGSGKSALLKRIMTLMANNETNEFYVIDSVSANFKDFESKSKYYATVDNAEQIETIMKALVECMNNRKALQNDTSNTDEDAKTLFNSENQICVFIDDISEFINNVDEKFQQWMANIARGATDLGVVIIAGIRSGDLANLSEIEALTNALVGHGKAIAVDGSPSMISSYSNDMSYDEKDKACGEDNAWVFDEGKCTKIKIMQ